MFGGRLKLLKQGHPERKTKKVAHLTYYFDEFNLSRTPEDDKKNLSKYINVKLISCDFPFVISVSMLFHYFTPVDGSTRLQNKLKFLSVLEFR